jgi:hypothetical protein
MNRLSIAARIAQIVMGAILLLAGVVKVWEPVLFYWDSIPYTQILGLGDGTWEWAVRAALLLAPLECFVGLALLVNWRPKLIFPIATVLMVGFLAVTTYAWKQGSLVTNCGCFGSLVERTPGEAAAEDVVMLGLLLFSWWGLNKWERPAWPAATQVVMGGLVLALLVGGLRFFPQLDRIAGSDLQPGIKLTGLPLQGSDIDLMSGEYLVELFSPRCGHCRQAVPKMNALADKSDFPQLVALNPFPMSNLDVVNFKQQLGPHYAIATISRTDFFRLTSGHGYPRLAYVSDGTVQRVWESNAIPTPQEMQDYFALIQEK